MDIIYYMYGGKSNIKIWLFGGAILTSLKKNTA